jgi:predicted RNA binding protein YcfA (HicA-like mRNA interferase family)
MPRLPVVTAKQIRAALLRCGFIERQQTGSHLTLRHPITKAIATVPMHRGEIKTGTLRSILRQAKLTVSELIELL